MSRNICTGRHERAMPHAKGRRARDAPAWEDSGIDVPAKDFGVLKQKFSGALDSPETQT